MHMKEDDYVSKSYWLYRNITGKKGLPMKKMRRVKDELQLLDNKYLKKPLEEKDYLEKRLSKVKEREENIKSMELKFFLQNFENYEDIDKDVKFEVSKILRKKYPQYAYILTIEDPNDINKRSTQRKYSSISSTPQFKNSKQPMPIAEIPVSLSKSSDDNFLSINAIKEELKIESQNYNDSDNVNNEDNGGDDGDDEEEEESYQQKYSGFINPKLETITMKNKKNVVKKESKAVTKIIQVSNDLRKWTDDNLSKKQIEPLDDYLGRSGHNIFEGLGG